MKKIIMIAVLIAFMSYSTNSYAHCEIPCGIYDDHMRIHMIEEHISTVEKSMQQIIALSEAGEKNYNQLVRWITNKEQHAQYIQEIIYQYFMAQRITPVTEAASPDYNKYIEELTLLHGILVDAMKAKQTTDLEVVGKLRAQLNQFGMRYFNKQKTKADLEKE